MPTMTGMSAMTATGLGDPGGLGDLHDPMNDTMSPTAAPKKSRTNTPWTPAEEQRLKTMRDAGNSWGEIAKVLKDMLGFVIDWLADVSSKDLPESNRRERKEALVQGEPHSCCEQDTSSQLTRLTGYALCRFCRGRGLLYPTDSWTD